MKHSVFKRTAVVNSASVTTKNYFPTHKKSKNKFKNSTRMAKTDENSEPAVGKKHANKQQSGKEKQKPPTKIVIRHLPPTMTEEEFLKQIDPLPAHDFYYFASADWSLGFDATCRAYITLKNYDDLFLFRDRFDGYVFVDAKGNEYAAIVEFAPFQGIVKNKSRRTDNKVNTIEEEAHYQQFLVKLTEEREMASKGGETKMEFNLNLKKEEITSTPLLQYLANKKEKRRLEAKKRVEEKRKQRDDDKEKRRHVVLEKNKEPQVTRIMTEKKEGAGGGGGDLKKEQKTECEVEEKPNSRNKRRNERNQKRQEAFLQRKLLDKSAKSAESADQSGVAENQNKEKTEQTNQREKKESRRERDREREKQRRERRDKAKAESKNERRNSATKNEIKILSKQEDESRQEEAEVALAATARATSPKRSGLSKREEEENKRQRAAEERRIRNKDRPSIAIYQPKARTRPSEESDTGGNVSAGERLNDTKKSEDTPQVKKVSRYSERRKRSAAKEKRKSSATDDEIMPKEIEPTTSVADTQ